MASAEQSDEEIVAEKSNFVQHGQLFHQKLLTLILERANYKRYESFSLSSELPEANSFDDIVFRYKKNPDSELLFRLLQVKSKETVKPKEGAVKPKGKGMDKIKESDLLSTYDSNSFGLQKYFISFLKVQNSCNGSLFFGSKIEDVILITNTSFESEEVAKHFEENEKLKGDDLLKIDLQSTPGPQAKPQAYKIIYDKKSDFIKELKKIILATSDNSELISRLAEHLSQGKPINIQQKHFNEYRFALIREVFESKTKKSKRNYTKLKSSFIDNKNLDSDLSRFRSSLLKEYLFLMEHPKKWFEKLEVRTNFSALSNEEKDRFVESIDINIDAKYEYRINTNEFDDLLPEKIIDSRSRQFSEEFLNKNNDLLDSIKKQIAKVTPKGRAGKDINSGIKFSLASDFGKLPYDVEKLRELAKTLADAIKIKKLGEINFDKITSDEFRRYIPALMEKVIDIETKTFKANFKSKNSNQFASTTLFRQFVIDEYFGSDEIEAAAMQLIFQNKEIKITAGFYKDIISAKEPADADFAKFVEKLKKLVARRNSDIDLITIDDLAIEAIITEDLPERNALTKNKRADFIKSNLKTFNDIMKTLAGHVFVERFRYIVFSRSFLSKDLKGSLKKLRGFLADIADTSQLEKLKFSIAGLKSFKEESFCCLLPKVPEPKDVEDFCKKFYLVLNYPDRNKINAIIESDLQKNTKTQCAALMQSKLETTISDWAANRVRTFYDKSSTNKLFNSIENLIFLNELQGITRYYFSTTTINEALQYDELIFPQFLSKDTKILHLAYEDLELSRTLVVKSFRKLKISEDIELRKYTINHCHLFFDLQLFSDGKFEKQLKNILEQKDTPLKLIVIECSKSQFVKKFSKKLFNLIELSKKIILVSKNFSYLFKEYPKLEDSCEEFPDYFDFVDGLQHLFQEKLVLN